MARMLKSKKMKGSPGLKKGKAPAPHQSPGRAAGAGKTSTSPVRAKAMKKPVGNSKGGGIPRGGSMTRGMNSPNC